MPGARVAIRASGRRAGAGSAGGQRRLSRQAARPAAQPPRPSSPSVASRSCWSGSTGSGSCAFSRSRIESGTGHGAAPAVRDASPRASAEVRRVSGGAAIVTALLVVTLAAVIVSALFYRESVAVRSIENRLGAVADPLGGAARRSTGPRSSSEAIRHLRPWQRRLGTPVVDTQLDETVTGGAKIGDSARNAFLAGSVVDAQAKFNVNTLVGADGQPSQAPPRGHDQADDTAGTAGIAGPAGSRHGSSGHARTKIDNQTVPRLGDPPDPVRRPARHSRLRRGRDAGAAAARDGVAG